MKEPGSKNFAINPINHINFNVKGLLRQGENEIEICFAALRFGQARLNERYIHSWSTDAHNLPGGKMLPEMRLLAQSLNER